MTKGDSRGLDIPLLIKGSIIGVANIIPGVSGGTLAVVLGIYDRLIGAIGNFLTDRKNRIPNLLFLAHIGVGAFIAIFLLSNVMDYLYEHYNVPTIYFFMGLIIGSIPTILRQHTDMRPNAKNMSLFMVGFLSVALLGLLEVSETGASTGDFNTLLLFLAGLAAAAAMIVPGFSGSFVLVAIGVYWDLIDAVKSFDLLVLIPPAIGGLIGIIGVSKVIGKILDRYPSRFYYFILGLIIASLFVLYPGVPGDNVELGLCAVSCISGATISLKLSK